MGIELCILLHLALTCYCLPEQYQNSRHATWVNLDIAWHETVCNTVGPHPQLCFPSPSCVWCCPAKFLLCWTSYISLVPHSIHRDTPCIQVSLKLTAFFADRGKISIFLLYHPWGSVLLPTGSKEYGYIRKLQQVYSMETFSEAQLIINCK